MALFIYPCTVILNNNNNNIAGIDDQWHLYNYFILILVYIYIYASLTRLSLDNALPTIHSNLG